MSLSPPQHVASLYGFETPEGPHVVLTVDTLLALMRHGYYGSARYFVSLGHAFEFAVDEGALQVICEGLDTEEASIRVTFDNSRVTAAAQEAYDARTLKPWLAAISAAADAMTKDAADAAIGS